MKIQFENVNFSSRSGPNGFGLKLARQLSIDGHALTNDDPDVRLSFVQSINDFSPMVLRLDGVWFNTEQDWKALNKPIKESYDYASAVIVQCQFDKKLISSFFGERDNVHVIHNGTDPITIESIPVANVGKPKENVWLCASSWRPHKRLQENIRLFKHFSKPDDILLVAGQNAEINDDDPRITAVGDLSWEQLISCMKAAGNFIHLAWLDHCPNVVVDARAAGCHIWCSSEGGTKEIAGPYSTIIMEKEWDFSPTRLYHPPKITFDCSSNKAYESSIHIKDVSEKYVNILESIRV
jgi:glycosyltransferase involved in cell wall biosynthesis